jgi:hypothetical protein
MAIEWRNGRMVMEWRNGRMAEWQNGGVVEWRSGGMALWSRGLKLWQWQWIAGSSCAVLDLSIASSKKVRSSPFSVRSTRVREKGVATIAFIVSFRYIRTIVILLSIHGRHPRNVDGVRNNGGMVEWRRWWNGGRNDGMVE